MKQLQSFEMSVNIYQSTRLNIQEDLNLYMKSNFFYQKEEQSSIQIKCQAVSHSGHDFHSFQVIWRQVQPK